MKRVLLIFSGFVISMLLFAFFGLLFSHRHRLVGVIGFSVMVIIAICWLIAMRRSRASELLRIVPQRMSPRVGGDIGATSWQGGDQALWRDDVGSRPDELDFADELKPGPGGDDGV